MSATTLQFVDDEADVRRCYGVMHQLRPHLASEDEFVARWRRQQKEAYRLLAVFGTDGPALAVAGYRVQENMIHGRFLYVDDLVTDEALRRSGHGERLIARLKEEARALACTRLVLDTAMSNSLGQRFYFRNGLLATAFRFGVPIAAA